MQPPRSSAESTEPTGAAEASPSLVIDDVRVTQAGEERIYNDDDLELVNQ